uniref:FlgK family flagellar hook-associated protein n=1 Tax=Pantanalinema rosaneae TaxID=1620701 RepID=UPI003D6F3BA0
MIGELSALMDIDVEAGQNGSVTIRTGTGATLFDGVNATRLTFDRRPALDAGMAYDQTNSTVGVIRAVSVAGASFDLVAGGAFRSGEIAAALEMRDAILPQAQRQLDELAAGLSRAFSDAPGTIDNATNTITFDANFTNQPVTVDLVIGGQFQRFSVAQPATRADLEAAITGAGFAGVTVTDPGGGEWRINGLPAQSAVLGASYTVTGTGSGAAPFPLFVDRAAANAPFTGVGGQLTGFAQRLAVNPAVVADRSLLVRMDGTTPQGDPTRPLAAPERADFRPPGLRAAGGNRRGVRAVHGFGRGFRPPHRRDAGRGRAGGATPRRGAAHRARHRGIALRRDLGRQYRPGDGPAPAIADSLRGERPRHDRRAGHDGHADADLRD